GATVLLPESDRLMADETFRRTVLGRVVPRATLAYGEPFTRPGLHLVASETEHWVENLTGLGGCGAQLVLAIAGQHGQQGHPLLPVIQAAEPAQRGRIPAADIDLFLTGDIAADTTALRERLIATAQGEYVPVANASGL